MGKPVKVTEIALDTDSDRDLDEIWPDVLTQYQAITGFAIPDSSDFGALSRKVDRDIETSKSKNKPRAKKILNNCAKCLQQFGGMIASAASIVFGPAGQCYNALNFVVNVVKDIQDLFDGFITLLEHCTAFLHRISLHLQSQITGGQSLAPHLRKPAYDGLQLFLQVQARSYNLTHSKREKLKRFAGVALFSDDDGVKGDLAKLYALSERLTAYSTDQILVNVDGLAKHLHQSDEERSRFEGDCREHLESLVNKADQNLTVAKDTLALTAQLTSSNEDRENLKKIADAVPFDKKELWMKYHQNFQKDRVEGTGKWLLNSDEFRSWASRSKLNKLVTLLGDAGYGKSYICSHAIDYLKKYSREASEERVCVAYYYFDKDYDIATCLGSIVYQLANQDKVYARAAAAACTLNGNLGSATKLWETLVTDLAGSMQERYFLIIDGFQAVNEDKVMEKVIQETVLRSKSSISLFIAGRHDDLGHLNEGALFRLGGGNYRLRRQRTQLSLENERENLFSLPALANEQDIIDVAAVRIETLCQGNSDLRRLLQDPKVNIPAKFARGVRGDYTLLGSKLKEISEAQDDSEIENIISRAAETRTQSFERVMSNLHDTLTSEEIQELNLILEWTYEAFSSDEKLLKAVVLWCLEKSYHLNKQIDTKFSALLRNDGLGTIDAIFAATTLRAATAKPEKDDPIPLAKSGAKLQQCEVDIIQHFVKSYCSQELYERFGFDRFFKEKITDPLAIIHLNDHNSIHISILRTCLDVFSERSKQGSFEPLREYASCWLGQHIDQIDLLNTDKSALEELGPKLVSILWDVEAIDAWWAYSIIGQVRLDWISYSENTEKLLQFLQFPLVKATFSSPSGSNDWIRSILAQTGNSARVLTKVAQRLADRWFGAVRQNAEFFWCAERIMAKIWDAGDSFRPNARPSIHEIDRFVKYVEQISVHSQDKVHWKTRYASILSIRGHNKEALDAIAEAEPKVQGDTPWPLLLVKSKALYDLKDYTSALTCLHEMQETNAISENPEDEYTKAYWEQIVLLEGRSHKARDDSAAATKCFFILLAREMSTSHFNIHALVIGELFDMWSKAKAFNLIIEHVCNWRILQDSKLDLHYWLSKVACMDRFHGITMLATVRMNVCHDICQIYDDAIKHLTQSKKDNEAELEVEALLYFHHAILYYGSTDDNDHQQALQGWERLIRANMDRPHYTWRGFSSATRLSRALLEKALAEEAEPISSSSYYAARLEQLAWENNPVLNDCRRGNSDPRLALARLRLKTGDEKSAKRISMSRLQKQFDHWSTTTESDAMSIRYSSIAHTLTVADDDVNAIAAWQLLALPYRKGEDTKRTGQSTNVEPGEGESESPESDKTDGTPGGTVDISTKVEIKAGQLPGETQSSAKVDEDELLFRAPMWYSCDGDCGTTWPVLEQLYVCKYCLDVQLCSSCWQKLQDSDLPPIVCSPKHEFLYLPEIDRAAWARAGSTSMVVNGEVISRQAWLDALRDRWDLRQDQIDRRRSLAAARFRMAVGVYVGRWRTFKKGGISAEEWVKAVDVSRKRIDGEGDT